MLLILNLAFQNTVCQPEKKQSSLIPHVSLFSSPLCIL